MSGFTYFSIAESILVSLQSSVECKPLSFSSIIYPSISPENMISETEPATSTPAESCSADWSHFSCSRVCQIEVISIWRQSACTYYYWTHNNFTAPHTQFIDSCATLLEEYSLHSTSVFMLAFEMIIWTSKWFFSVSNV